MRKNVVFSDLSGAVITSGTGAVVTIRYRDRLKSDRVLDLTDAEAERLGGRHKKRRRLGDARSADS